MGTTASGRTVTIREGMTSQVRTARPEQSLQEVWRMLSETAADVMTRALETIYVDEPVETAIDRIGVGEFHALVVLDEDDALAGIVTHHDLLHYLAD